jgi:signal recognition particle subunit SRP54
VQALVEAYKNYAKYATQALKAAGLPKLGKGGAMRGDIGLNPRHMQQTLQRMGGALPPQMIQQLGGMGGLQQLMKAMESMDKGGGRR